MSDASLAGSVIVDIGGNLTPFEASLARAEAMANAFNTRMAAVLASSGAGAAMPGMSAAVEQTGAALTAVTAPATVAAAKIAAVGESAVAAAISTEQLVVSAADIRAAMAGGALNAANFSKALAEVTGANEAAAASTVALAEATTAGAVSMGAMGAAETETAGMSAQVSREFMVLGAEVARGNFSRIPGSLMRMNGLLASTGTSMLTMKNIAGVFGSLGAVIFNPYILGFLAITVGLDLGVKAFEKFNGSADAAAEALKRQKQIVDELTLAYPKLGKALKDALDQSPTGTNNQMLITSQTAIDAAQRQVSQLTGKLNQGISSAFAPNLGTGNLLSLFPALASQVNELDNEFKSGVITATTLGDRLAGLELNPQLPGIAKAVLDNFIGIANQIAVAQIQANAFASTMAALKASGGLIIGSDFSQLQSSADLIDKLKAITPDLRSATQKATDLYNSNSGLDASGDAKKQLDYTLAQIKLQESLKASRTANPIMGSLTALDKQTAGLTAQANSYGMSTAQIAANEKAQELLTQAEDKAGKAAPALIALIKQKADAYGLAAQNAKIAQANDNNAFSRSMLGLNSGDQSIASTLKGIYGGDWAGQMNGTIAQTMRMTAALADFKQTTMDASNTFVSTFVADLKNGTPVIQSFADAAIAAFDQIASKLETMAIDNLVSNAFGGLTGSGSSGSGSGILGSILGLFGASSGSSSLTSTLGMGANGVIGGFATGGLISGPGSSTSDSINARLSNGEFVVKAAAVPANLNSLVAMNKGYAAGGLVGSANSNSPMAANGNAAPIYISIDARGAQEGVAVQVAQAVRDAVRYRMPAAIRQNNANPYRVGYSATPATGK